MINVPPLIHFFDHRNIYILAVPCDFHPRLYHRGFSRRVNVNKQYLILFLHLKLSNLLPVTSCIFECCRNTAVNRLQIDRQADKNLKKWVSHKYCENFTCTYYKLKFCHYRHFNFVYSYRRQGILYND